jgi:hypothetical protein
MVRVHPEFKLTLSLMLLKNMHKYDLVKGLERTSIKFPIFKIQT